MAPKIDNVWLVMFFLASAAIVLTLTTGEDGLSGTKTGGVLSGLVAFVPVFLILRHNFVKATPTKFLKLFVLGFLYKLLFIVSALSLMIAVLNWPIREVAVPCLLFLLAGQIYAAVFFYCNRNLLSDMKESRP